MSTKQVGPYTINSNLVLHLDAANPDSYPGTGATWYDISGNSNHGTLINSPLFIENGGRSLFTFDGVDDYVSIPTLNVQNEWTVSLMSNNGLYGYITNSTSDTGRLRFTTGLFSGIGSIVFDSNDNFYIGTFGMGEFNNIFRFPYLKFDSEGNLDEDFKYNKSAGGAIGSNVAISSDNRLFGGGTNVSEFSEININTGSIIYNETRFNGNYTQTYLIDEIGRWIYRTSTNTTTYNGNTWRYIAKMDLDTFDLDTTFDPLDSFNSSSDLAHIGFDTNGNIYYRGRFSTYQGSTANHIALVNAQTAALETSFTTGTGFNDARYINYEVDSLGRVYAFGIYFTTYNGITTTRRLIRLNPDGTLDTTYISNLPSFLANSYTFRAIKLQPDDKLLLRCNDGMFRFNEDGTQDTSFTTGVHGGYASLYIGPIGLQSDGKIILSNYYPNLTYTYNGTLFKTFIRLNLDGTIDPTFNINVGFTNTTKRLELRYTIKNTSGAVQQLINYGISGRNSPSWWRQLQRPPRLWTFTKGADNVLKIYLSGNLYRSFSLSSNTMDLNIDQILQINGNVNSIKIFDKTLTEEEIQNESNQLINRFGYSEFNYPPQPVNGFNY